jgi:hypothetical protein
MTPAARRLQLTRASYGVALVMAPGLVIYLATGRFPSRRARGKQSSAAVEPPERDLLQQQQECGGHRNRYQGTDDAQ